jgi:predicted AAA+ superfamily ATPase
LSNSTVLRELADSHGVEVIDLDDVETREAMTGNLTSVTAGPVRRARRNCREQGGLPLAIRRSETGRARWFDDYVRQSVERDAADLMQVRQRQSLADLLTYVAAQTGQLLNITKAAESVGVERKTAETHLLLLEDLFLLLRLPSWGKTLRSRVSARPKVHVVDSGLAARLLRLTPASWPHSIRPL